MAISKTIEYKGITVVDCYIKVISFHGNKSNISFTLGMITDGNIIKKDSRTIRYDVNGENPITQAYLYAKTLPEYQGAIDC